MTDHAFHRAGLLAGGVVSVGVRLLPSDHRDRYYDEFRADLCLVPRGRQLGHALGLLAGALPLRRALAEHSQEELPMSHVYWKCRLGRHHYLLVNDDNPENRASTHLECTRCLKLKEIKEYVPTDGRYLAGGGIGMGG